MRSTTLIILAILMLTAVACLQAEPTEGDCIILEENGREKEAGTPKVACDGEWTHRVLSIFEVEKPGPYPGEDYFKEQAYEKCGAKIQHDDAPIEEAWQANDRTNNLYGKELRTVRARPRKG